MSSPSGPAILGRVAGTTRAAGAQKHAGDLQEYDAGPLWMRVLPPVVTFVVMLVGITVPSYWRDESATLSAVNRPFGELIKMLGNVDAVHASYYMVAFVIARLFGTGELALRMPSAIAMAVAAVFVAAIGRRIVSPWAGLFAGLMFTAVPDISLYGQDARSYAMETAMAAIASYMLVRALGAGHAYQRRWWVGYCISVAILGLLNIFGLLLLVAHGVTMALRMARPSPGQSRRALLLRWLVAAVIATIVVSPIIYLGYSERAQISWMTAPGVAGLTSLTKLIGPDVMAAAVAIVFVAGIVITLGRSARVPAWLTSLPALCVPWLLLPPLILLAASAVDPVYNFRYILYCVPAAVLLAGAGLAGLGRVGGVVALVLVAFLGLNQQIFYRTPGGHGDNIRQADQLIAASARPGDLVIYPNDNAEDFGAAYPDGLGKLRNIQLAQLPIPSGTLGGTNVSASVLHTRLVRATARLWVVEINNVHPPGSLFRGTHYKLTWTWHTSDMILGLYVKR
jgi:mannosyltransferase